ncbi:hypothetical protein [Teichococcus wenyumeiae]|nr:hypothetical protein [Pseudoroseomonas wenyumeiae]
MLKSAQNDLDVLEDVIASMADGVPLPVLVSRIIEARSLLGMLQSECRS